MPKKTQTERFLEKINHNRETGCLEWTGWISNTGYGFFNRGDGKSRLAHRASYELFCGEIPKGLHVLHKCDNPRCVKPSHLFLGTELDNKRDMVKKKRQAYGERNGKSKLTQTLVAEIRSRTDLKLRELSEMFGVSIQQASRIRRKEQWKNLE